MRDKIKIVFVIPSLTSGGAERIVSYLAQNLEKEKFEATLLVIGHQKDVKYEVKGIEIVFLEKSRILAGLPGIIKILRKNRFDIVMGAIRHMNALLGCVSILFPKTKFVGRETNVMSVRSQYDNSSDRKYPSFIYRFSYARLDAIICQSKDMLKDLALEFPKTKHKLHLIHNPITKSFTVKNSKTPSTPPYRFITVASLSPRKGLFRILDGLSQFNGEFTYTIIGKGCQKTALEAHASQLGLEKQLKMIPFTNNVPKYLADSHIFIQGSFVEGFPNALLESCAVGTPVIAFDAPGGINEIVQEGINGLVIKDVGELPRAIDSILHSDSYTPDTISRSVFEKYASSIVLEKYEHFFEGILK